MGNKQKGKLIPELRFNEFQEEWKSSKLGNIAEFDKGRNISKADTSEDGETECIRYGELYTRYKEIIEEVYSRTNLDKGELVFSEKGDVLTPSSGETAIDIATASCINKKDVALGGDINIIRSDINGNFLAYYLSNKKRTDVARLAQGISVIHLYKSHLKSLSVNLPSKAEQQKISSFLSLIDKKIELLKKKKELLELYKKGVMQKIFNREIRFKDNNGNDYPEWEEKRLGEIGNFQRGHSYNSREVSERGVLVVRSSNIQDGRLVLDKNLQFVTKENKPEIDLQKDDVIICMSNGSRDLVGKTGIYEGNYTGNITTGAFCSIYRSNDNFTKLFFDTSLYQGYLHVLLGGTNINNLRVSDMEKIKLELPKSQVEKNKILAFVGYIKELVNVSQNKIEYGDKFKKGLLQKMFI